MLNDSFKVPRPAGHRPRANWLSIKCVCYSACHHVEINNHDWKTIWSSKCLYCVFLWVGMDFTSPQQLLDKTLTEITLQYAHVFPFLLGLLNHVLLCWVFSIVSESTFRSSQCTLLSCFHVHWFFCSLWEMCNKEDAKKQVHCCETRLGKRQRVEEGLWHLRKEHDIVSFRKKFGLDFLNQTIWKVSTLYCLVSATIFMISRILRKKEKFIHFKKGIKT